MKKFRKETLIGMGISQLRETLWELEGRALPKTSSRDKPWEYRNYLYLTYGAYKPKLCPVCKDAYLALRPAKLEFRETCGSKGCYNTLQKEKRIATLMRKFGVTNPSQLEEVKQKKRETCLRNLGVEYPMQSKKVREKLKANNLRKYGKENVSQVIEFQEKREATFIKRFGGNPYANPAIKEKLKRIHMEKRGVPYASQCPKAKAKARRTSLRKYGVSHHMKSKESLARRKALSLAKYGVPYPVSLPEVRDRMSRSQREVDNKARAAKVSATCRKKYGVDWASQDPAVKAKARKTLIRKAGSLEAAHKQRAQRTRKNNIEKYGVPSPMQSDVYNKIAGGFKVRYAKQDTHKILPLRGYEPLVVEIILNKLRGKVRISSGSSPYLPKIFYKDRGKLRRYHPDLYVQSLISDKQTILEVKSAYTLAPNREGLRVNRLKARAATKLLSANNIQYAIVIPVRGRLLLVPQEVLGSMASVRAFFKKHGIAGN